MRKDIMLAISLILIAMAVAGGLYFYVQRTIEPVDVYVYNGNLVSGTPISQDNVKTVKMSRNSITNDFALSPKDMAGLTLKQNVYDGNIVYKSQLSSDVVQNEDLGNIDWGKYRKYTLPITAINRAIKRGKKVDLLFSGSGEGQNEKNESGETVASESKVEYAKVFMQDVLVYESSFDNLDKNGEADTKPFATLILTLDQIEQLKARSRVGDIALIERNEGAKSYETLGYVTGNYSKKFMGFGDAETGDYVPNEDKYKEK